jgi:hypothetical protein
MRHCLMSLIVARQNLTLEFTFLCGLYEFHFFGIV